MEHKVDNCGICYIKDFKSPSIMLSFDDKSINIKNLYGIIFLARTRLWYNQYSRTKYLMEN